VIPVVLKRAYALTWDILDRFSRHYGWAIASHVALSALLALFPFLIVVVSLASLFGTNQNSQDLVNLALGSWPADVSAPIAREIERVLTGRRSDLLTLGIFVMLWIASSGIEALRVALDNAYASPDYRPWWRLRLQSILYVVLGAIGFIMLAVAVVIWPAAWNLAIVEAPWLQRFGFVVDIGRYGLTGIFLFLSLILFHIWLAHGKRGAREVLPGVILTITLWLVTAATFGAYLANFANYTATYAGLGSVMAAIFFLYINAVSFILGAEFNAALSARGEAESKQSS